MWGFLSSPEEASLLRHSMALTSPWCPAHWVRDRPGESPLPLRVVLDVVESVENLAVADDVPYLLSALLPYQNQQSKGTKRTEGNSWILRR